MPIPCRRLFSRRGMDFINPIQQSFNVSSFLAKKSGGLAQAAGRLICSVRIGVFHVLDRYLVKRTDGSKLQNATLFGSAQKRRVGVVISLVQRACRTRCPRPFFPKSMKNIRNFIFQLQKSDCKLHLNCHFFITARFCLSLA